MNPISNRELRTFIATSFNENELLLFCDDYFPEVKDWFGLGMPFNIKVQELILYCQRHGLHHHLLTALQQERSATYQNSFSPNNPLIIPPLPYQPYTRHPQKIFFCHASTDYALAKQITTDLKRLGHDVFITPDSIAPGEKWVPAISRGLEECGLFIVLLTPRAIASGWVNHEVNIAIDLATKGLAKLWFLDTEPCQPPILWRQWQWIWFRETYAHNWAALEIFLEKKILQQHVRVVSSSLTHSQLPEHPKQYTDSQTGLEFVCIPEGAFIYSEGETEKRLHLSRYWICKTPVTQQAYQLFIEANRRYPVPFVGEEWAQPYNWDQQKRRFPPNKTDHPVVQVSWHDAMAFCVWAGMNLPTEQQWEKAARGTDGRIYPWSNELPTIELCNINRNIGGTTPVKTYWPRGNSPYGCLDMSGNVWEWCLNKYATPEDIAIDQTDAGRVLRGGSWMDPQDNVRTTFRGYDWPDLRFNLVGFRPVLRQAPTF